jgi:peroxiredoxin
MSDSHKRILHDPTVLPEDLPVPRDDGAARTSPAQASRTLRLRRPTAREVDLSALAGRTVVYVYPRTGRPGQASPTGWDGIPGARGCTPQSCGFRDHFAELKRLGVAQLFGLSTQDTDYQREAVERLHLPFAILSDADLKLTRALDLPTFAVDGMTLIRRMAWVIDDGVIRHVFYPVFPPDKNAEEVVELDSAIQISADRPEHGAKHLRRQHTGIRVVARAVIAVEQRELADRMHCAVHERRRREAMPERPQRGLVRDAAERHDGAQPRHCGMRCARKASRQVLISAGVGLFSGGTQCTALVMRASIRVRPSSGRASNVPREKPNSLSVA